MFKNKVWEYKNKCSRTVKFNVSLAGWPCQTSHCIQIGQTTKAIIQNMNEKRDTKTGHQTGTTREDFSVSVMDDNLPLIT